MLALVAGTTSGPAPAQGGEQSCKGAPRKEALMSVADLLCAFAPEQRTLPAMLERQARLYGDRLLLVAGAARLSFDEMLMLAARFAGTLSAAGVRRGDRVALMSSNRVEFMQVYLGCAWLGAIVVPINIASRGPQLAHVLCDCGARLLIVEADSVRPRPCGQHRRQRSNGYGSSAMRPARRLVEAFPSPLCRHLGKRCLRPRSSLRRPRQSLHLGHDRPIKGRMLPACAVFLVGPQLRAPPRHSRRRRALHYAAAVSRQCARQLLSGAADRLDPGRRAALFGLALLGELIRARCAHHLPAGRHGPDPVVAGAVCRKSAPIASGALAPGYRLKCMPPSRNAPASA